MQAICYQMPKLEFRLHQFFHLIRTGKNHYMRRIDTHNNNTTTSQYGSHFYEVWGDPDVGNLTSTDIPTRREANSKRPTKKIL